jgi:hypothetical protein
VIFRFLGSPEPELGVKARILTASPSLAGVPIDRKIGIASSQKKHKVDASSLNRLLCFSFLIGGVDANSAPPLFGPCSISHVVRHYFISSNKLGRSDLASWSLDMSYLPMLGDFARTLRKSVTTYSRRQRFRRHSLETLEQRQLLAGASSLLLETTAASPPGLIAYFHFDEGSGKVADGGDIDGTVRGASWVDGRFGAGLSFDGQGDYVDLGKPDLPAESSGLTLAAWIKIDDAGAIDEGRIISKATGTSNDDHYWMLSAVDSEGESRLRFRLKTGDDQDSGTTTLIASSGNLQSDRWQHVAATYDGAAMKIYLDGVLVGQTAKQGTVATNDAVPAWIGGNPPDRESRDWDGTIDEVRIYATALSATAVANLAAGLVGQDTVPPIITAPGTMVGSSAAVVAWTTDEPATSRVDYGLTPALGSTASVSVPSRLATKHFVLLNSLRPDTTYYYRVASVDAAGNAVWGELTSLTTAAVDTTPPTIALDTPGFNSIVRGQVTVTATATDNVAVREVEFLRNGESIGIDIAAPYEMQWNTQDVRDGQYNLTAIARDVAGNETVSNAVVVSVRNNPPADQSRDLLAHFAFDEGGGNLVGGGGMVGMLRGPSWVGGHLGSALQFDGNQDYVDLATADLPTDTSGLTLAAWIKIDDVGTIDEGRIISKSTGTSNEDHFWMLSTSEVDGESRLRFRLKTGHLPDSGTTTLVADSGVLRSGVWQHAAATYDGAAMKLYLDGMLVGQTAKTGMVATDSDVQTWIGGNPTDPQARDWQGAIDDLRIYTRGLAPSEIASLVHGNGAIDTRPPVISNNQKYATSTAALVAWQTDEPTTALVEYGLTPLLGSTTELKSEFSNRHLFSLSGLQPGNTYYYRVRSMDAAGNLTTGDLATFETTAANVVTDTTSPTVSLTKPTKDGTVSGQVSLSANASDNIGVTQVEFKVNGNSIGVDTTAPYAVSWNSASVSDGSYNLTAVARDAAGNVTSSTALAVRVDNSPASDGFTIVNVSTPAELQAALKNATGGETIRLAAGNYGSLSINNRSYASTVTIQSRPGQLAVFNQLSITNSSRLTVDRVRVSYPTNPPFNSTLGLVKVDGTSSDVTVSNSRIHGPIDGNYAGGTGVRVEGTTTGVRIENNMIHDIRDGMLFSDATNLSVIGNQVENIRKDVMSFIGVQRVLIENNTGARFRHPESGDHLDFIQFQGQDSRDVIIRGNVVLPGSAVNSQGIFMDDAKYTNFTIENNVIYAGNNRGISFGTDAIDGGGNVARYNTILTPPNWGGKAGLLSVPGGNNEYNITSHNSKNDGIRGTNHVISYDDPGSPFYYNDYYRNAMAGPGITIEDLRPVAGSPAEKIGAFARINELLGR